MDLPCENLQGKARVPTPAVSPAPAQPLHRLPSDN